MLTAFVRAFRTPDLRSKILFSMGIMALFRLGSVMPTPGVSYEAVQDCINNNADTGLYSLINLFSGGALLQLSIFALGIMPYITASIIVQLLTVVIPRVEALKKEGQSGTAKLTQYTRYLTLALAILQATGIVALARSRQLLQGCQDPLLYNEKSLMTMRRMAYQLESVMSWLHSATPDVVGKSAPARATVMSVVDWRIARAIVR